MSMKKCTFCDFCEENVTESGLRVSIGRRIGVVAYKMTAASFRIGRLGWDGTQNGAGTAERRRTEIWSGEADEAVQENGEGGVEVGGEAGMGARGAQACAAGGCQPAEAFLGEQPGKRTGLWQSMGHAGE